MAVTLSEKKVGDVTIIKPVGRFDSQTSPVFETAIGEKLEAARHVVLDFGDVPYMSSAGLRVILVVAQRLGKSQGRFALTALKPEILDVFKISGLTSVIKIYDTTDAAVAAFGAG